MHSPDGATVLHFYDFLLLIVHLALLILNLNSMVRRNILGPYILFENRSLSLSSTQIMQVCEDTFIKALIVDTYLFTVPAPYFITSALFALQVPL